ncbi:hypothetical protein HQ487_03055 [Candidatus Uhrbacteria bacterium]|nr:hypothetical protein [Candidatus Uhrbacteria bacterium]
MKFKIISLFLILSSFFAIQADASGSWTLKDLGMIQGLRSVAVLGDRVMAVGNAGNIISSSDSGGTWSVIDQNTSVYWRDIETLGDHVWVAGEGSAMRESLDGGSTWSNVTLGITEHINDMDISESYGYLVGASGRLMTYNHASSQWVSISTTLTTLELNRVQDMGDGTAWIVGASGYLYYGHEGGSQWRTIGQITQDDLYGVWFRSATEGYAVGRNGTFIHTTDGNYSWSTIAVDGLSYQNLYDIQVNGDQMVVVGDQIILKSDDAGVTWTSYPYAVEDYTFRGAVISDTGIWVVGTQDDVQSIVLYFEEDEVIVEEEVVEEEPVVEEEASEAEPSHLIKLACSTEIASEVNDPCRAVYYYATDGKRHAFTNENVFLTWFENFDDVVEVSSDFLSSLTLGSNVTYHPGTRMVKFLSVPTVYAVSEGGILRAIESESVAVDLYGDTWNQQIDDISDAFLGNYSFGEDVTSIIDYDVDEETASITSLDDNF